LPYSATNPQATSDLGPDRCAQRGRAEDCWGIAAGDATIALEVEPFKRKTRLW